MAGRPKIFDKHEVVNKAADLFWSKGYEAASTEELLAAMGIGKGSFYLAFPEGKRELFEKALDQFNNGALQRLYAALEKGGEPVEAIRRFFLDMAVAPKEEHGKGCFMGNTVAALSNIDDELKQKAVQRLKQLEQLFYNAISKAKQQGTLKTGEDTATLARYLLTLWNGLNITRRMYTDPKVLRPLIELQLKILH
ncbi:TetR/AcrR family transcriptional regulator [Chitinophaga japonensis]|uniref:TetR family transcriptional regulator n=1 Tax=Chitinophaga japonensis TaxID=104662 RepID=A0A562T3A5_CHIJA|nr:TetR/AcrR family transcriptional regulator [Chitinophaga japonensis]TWI88057.1 TetR family transcriptional regulator [Chitinophaga japonensis]